MIYATIFIITPFRPAPVLTLVIVLAGLWLASSAQAQKELPLELLVIETATDKHLFQVEVVRTDAQRAIGLMWRERMDPDKGMLFEF